MKKLAVTTAAALLAAASASASPPAHYRFVPSLEHYDDIQIEDNDVYRGAIAPEPSKTTGWLYAGLGICSVGVAAYGSLNLKHGRFLGTCRTSLNAGGMFGDYFYDVGLLFGYYPVQSFSVAAGIAMVGGTRVGSSFFGYEHFDGIIGVPLELQFTPVKGRVSGLGLTGYFNFNEEESLVGFTVGMQLGKLK